jgi:phage/plasmid-associated DNA primase
MIPFPFNHRGSAKTASEIDRENTTPIELSGILNRAASALQTLMERGKFAEPAGVVAAKEEFREHGDRVRGWVKECALINSRIPFTERKALYTSFERYSESDHGKGLRAAEFYARLKQIDGVREKTLNGKRGFSKSQPHRHRHRRAILRRHAVPVRQSLQEQQDHGAGLAYARTPHEHEPTRWSEILYYPLWDQTVPPLVQNGNDRDVLKVA